jgi:hypothetical protein
MGVAQAFAVMAAARLWGPHEAPREAMPVRDSYAIRAGQPRRLTDSKTRFDLGQTLRGTVCPVWQGLIGQMHWNR